jgi:hypothetical protein
MPTETPGTADLIEHARPGDGRAPHDLLVRHRSRLRSMVAAHMDRRLY